MKIFCFPAQAGFFYQKPDTALIKADENFYIPPFCTLLGFSMAFAVKIDRLGRSIAPRFAYRYYSRYQTAVCLYALDRLEQARKEGEPWTGATCIDYSLPMSRNFYSKDGDPIDRSRWQGCLRNPDGQILREIGPFGMESAYIDRQIAFLSQSVYLKMGDLIVFEWHSPIVLSKGCRLQAGRCGEAPSVDFAIR